MNRQRPESPTSKVDAMFRIPCPYCGERAETEFIYGGQTHLARPEPSERVSDREWAEYLFYRDNPKGLHFERWQHHFGCRQWFNMARHTVSHEIVAVYRMDEARPDIEPEETV